MGAEQIREFRTGKINSVYTITKILEVKITNTIGWEMWKHIIVVENDKDKQAEEKMYLVQCDDRGEYIDISFLKGIKLRPTGEFETIVRYKV